MYIYALAYEYLPAKTVTLTKASPDWCGPITWILKVYNPSIN